MATSTSEKSEGLRLLEGLEEGTLDTSAAYNIAIKRDPVLLYFILRFLREKYPPTDPNAKGVMARLIELTATHSDLVKVSQKGEKDILREWFDDTYSMREFFSKPDEFIDMLVDKIEG